MIFIIIGILVSLFFFLMIPFALKEGGRIGRIKTLESKIKEIKHNGKEKKPKPSSITVDDIQKMIDGEILIHEIFDEDYWETDEY